MLKFTELTVKITINQSIDKIVKIKFSDSFIAI